ncbi:hypothetical protein HF086_006529 [Spodoptera exigua]|uniref:Uncharacterized protein n=1 Tax=Spodoptera exigua TaxID=7107 RepID=A0A922MKY5_SPOEX|nr:hypothetical protein HF086_006529 [Spodoptera exigua]
MSLGELAAFATSRAVLRQVFGKYGRGAAEHPVHAIAAHCWRGYKRGARAVSPPVAAAPSFDMIAFKNTIVYFLLFSVAVLGKHKKMKPKKFVSPTTKGIQCYNCLSFDHPGCWDPDHPDYANITVPNIDCYIPGMAFLCIVITSESAKLGEYRASDVSVRTGRRAITRAMLAVETGQEIGPVRARTCVPAKDFSKKTVSYSMCSKLSKELSASEIFSRIAVSRPQCTLCKKHLCTDASHC